MRSARPPAPKPKEEAVDIEARLDAGLHELLQRRDFDTMTAEEWAAARRALAGMAPALTVDGTARSSALGTRCTPATSSTAKTQRSPPRSTTRSRGARAALCPAPRNLVLLADARLIGKPDLYIRWVDAFVVGDFPQRG